MSDSSDNSESDEEVVPAVCEICGTAQAKTVLVLCKNAGPDHPVGCHLFCMAGNKWRAAGIKDHYFCTSCAEYNSWERAALHRHQEQRAEEVLKRKGRDLPGAEMPGLAPVPGPQPRVRHASAAAIKQTEQMRITAAHKATAAAAAGTKSPAAAAAAAPAVAGAAAKQHKMEALRQSKVAPGAVAGGPGAARDVGNPMSDGAAAAGSGAAGSPRAAPGGQHKGRGGKCQTATAAFIEGVNRGKPGEVNAARQQALAQRERQQKRKAAAAPAGGRNKIPAVDAAAATTLARMQPPLQQPSRQHTADSTSEQDYRVSVGVLTQISCQIVQAGVHVTDDEAELHIMLDLKGHLKVCRTIEAQAGQLQRAIFGDEMLPDLSTPAPGEAYKQLVGGVFDLDMHPSVIRYNENTEISYKPLKFLPIQHARIHVQEQLMDRGRFVVVSLRQRLLVFLPTADGELLLLLPRDAENTDDLVQEVVQSVMRDRHLGATPSQIEAQQQQQQHQAQSESAEGNQACQPKAEHDEVQQLPVEQTAAAMDWQQQQQQQQEELLEPQGSAGVPHDPNLQPKLQQQQQQRRGQGEQPQPRRVGQAQQQQLQQLQQQQEEEEEEAQQQQKEQGQPRTRTRKLQQQRQQQDLGLQGDQGSQQQEKEAPQSQQQHQPQQQQDEDETMEQGDEELSQRQQQRQRQELSQQVIQMQDTTIRKEHDGQQDKEQQQNEHCKGLQQLDQQGHQHEQQQQRAAAAATTDAGTAILKRVPVIALQTSACPTADANTPVASTPVYAASVAATHGTAVAASTPAMRAGPAAAPALASAAAAQAASTPHGAAAAAAGSTGSKLAQQASDRKLMHDSSVARLLRAVRHTGAGQLQLSRQYIMPRVQDLMEVRQLTFYMLGFQQEQLGPDSKLAGMIAAAQALGATVHWKDRQEVLAALCKQLALPGRMASAASTPPQSPGSSVCTQKLHAAAERAKAAAAAAGEAQQQQQRGDAYEEDDKDVVDLTAFEDDGEGFCNRVLLVPQYTTAQGLQEVLGPNLPLWQLLASPLAIFWHNSEQGILKYIQQRWRKREQRRQQQREAAAAAAGAHEQQLQAEQQQQKPPVEQRESTQKDDRVIRLSQADIGMFQLFRRGIAVVPSFASLLHSSKASISMLLQLLAQGRQQQQDQQHGCDCGADWGLAIPENLLQELQPTRALLLTSGIKEDRVMHLDARLPPGTVIDECTQPVTAVVANAAHLAQQFRLVIAALPDIAADTHQHQLQQHQQQWVAPPAAAAGVSSSSMGTGGQRTASAVTGQALRPESSKVYLGYAESAASRLALAAGSEDGRILTGTMSQVIELLEQVVGNVRASSAGKPGALTGQQQEGCDQR